VRNLRVDVRRFRPSDGSRRARRPEAEPIASDQAVGE
jgi:hypothetical protein